MCGMEPHRDKPYAPEVLLPGYKCGCRRSMMQFGYTLSIRWRMMRLDEGAQSLSPRRQCNTSSAGGRRLRKFEVTPRLTSTYNSSRNPTEKRGYILPCRILDKLGDGAHIHPSM